MKRRSTLRLLLTTTGLLLSCTSHAETWRFAVIGDTPYSSYEEREFPRMLEDIAGESPQLIVHAGDLKSSREPCSDTLFQDRRALLDASRVPLIYVPGDNEWTDCHLQLAGHFDPQERLQKLREIFFAAPRSLGQQTLPVEQQRGDYVEQLLWRLGPVLFVSLNVPGWNNNFGEGSKPSEEYLARNPRVIEWLEQAFASARREQAAGVVIVMQGNPGFKHDAAGLTHSGFRQLLETLRRETLAFSGQVLLIHGDTHWQRIDQPLRDPTTKRPLANFTRLETFGYPIMGWVKVIIDSELPQLFRFEVHAHQHR
ncbi:metallophosphoesterase family protein [Accumulibacter sp.]|uniref:metallophosphoesterase family protein n=1 Tax=Accumulibacter sp. TaxID=2053492 RepID=UPI001D81384F|nr:metallophosphoesterase family protein [Accumulibacter sp.]MCB1965940.1 metallophosphoesterase [Accumulibacter sp.]MCP5229787.1 metallophosphoesterase [Accumulibacter sp.]